MESYSLHYILQVESLDRLEKVIDWLERPWEPRRNDALRALWHEARRDSRAKFNLVGALEREVLTMPARDLEHVARRLGFQGAAATALDVIRLVTKRLERGHVEAPCVAPHPLLEPLAAAASATSEVLVSLLEGATHSNCAHRHSRRRASGTGRPSPGPGRACGSSSASPRARSAWMIASVPKRT
ncbi:hypothetical protein [Hyalangium gracile]|uniref:hypothetical protein n=1 Tax=Hyalangium gracile TaxID=394092 RepID=UPI001CCEDB5A|nr:hypothetical protein [Hyalangium gracile]